MQLNRFDNQIRRILHHFHADGKERLWEAITQELDRRRAYKKTFLSLLLATCFTAVCLFIPQPNKYIPIAPFLQTIYSQGGKYLQKANTAFQKITVHSLSSEPDLKSSLSSRTLSNSTAAGLIKDMHSLRGISSPGRTIAEKQRMSMLSSQESIDCAAPCRNIIPLHTASRQKRTEESVGWSSYLPHLSVDATEGGNEIVSAAAFVKQRKNGYSSKGYEMLAGVKIPHTRTGIAIYHAHDVEKYDIEGQDKLIVNYTLLQHEKTRIIGGAAVSLYSKANSLNSYFAAVKAPNLPEKKTREVGVDAGVAYYSPHLWASLNLQNINHPRSDGRKLTLNRMSIEIAVAGHWQLSNAIAITPYLRAHQEDKMNYDALFFTHIQKIALGVGMADMNRDWGYYSPIGYVEMRIGKNFKASASYTYRLSSNLEENPSAHIFSLGLKYCR